MSSVVVDLPKPLEIRLKEIAKRSGVSVSDLLVEAADKMSQIDVLERISESASARNARAGFERVLAAVPDVPPTQSEDIIKQ